MQRRRAHRILRGGSDVYSLPVFGYPGEEGGEIRDERFEARVRSVRAILRSPGAFRAGGAPHRRLGTRELLSAILPSSPCFRCSGAF